MKMAATVNERVTKGVTAQGFYVAAAGGKGYGFNNNRTVERVNWFMDNALKKMKADPPQVVEIPQLEVDAPFARSPGDGTSVLRIFTRIRPVPAGAHKSNNSVARDHIWIYKNEVQELQEAAKVAGGKSFPLPKTVAGRLVRFHFVDNIRGEPNFWRPAEVQKANFTCTFVRTSSTSTLYKLSGTFAMRTADNARGMEGKIEGNVVVTNKAQMIVQAYGEGSAWGAGTYTPNPPAGKFPMVFAIVTADDAVSRVVTPQAATWAGEYEKPGLR